MAFITRLIGILVVIIFGLSFCGTNDRSNQQSTEVGSEHQAETHTRVKDPTQIDLSEANHFTHIKNAESCNACHSRIYEEWQQSWHAMSSPAKNPIHQNVVTAYQHYKLSIDKPVDYHCAPCHTPAVLNKSELMSGEATFDLEDPHVQEGISCRICHSINGINRNGLFNQPAYNEKTVIMSSGKGKGRAFHPVEEWQFPNMDEFCFTCHGRKENKNNVKICILAGDMGEFKTPPGGSTKTCMDCHMPLIEGAPAAGSHSQEHLSHRFLGGHDVEMVKQATALSLNQNEAGELVVILQNLTHHKFPSSQPLRQASLLVKFEDDAGQTVWSNADHITPTDKTLLALLFESEEGQVGVPPWLAANTTVDSRLNSGEHREYQFIIPDGCVLASVTLRYRLVSPKAVDSFGIEPEFGMWKTIHERTFSLNR